MFDITKVPMYPSGIQSEEIKDVLDEIFYGLFERIGRHTNKPFHSTHEIYGKIMEEIHEFMEEVIGNDDDESYKELMDVVCAGVWGLLSMRHWKKDVG